MAFLLVLAVVQTLLRSVSCPAKEKAGDLIEEEQFPTPQGTWKPMTHSWGGEY